MRYIKKFNEEGEEFSIEDWCKKQIIRNITINEDGTVDVDSFVDLSYGYFKEIPIQFGVVEGNFDCGHNFLNTLKGCAYKINGSFNCANNKLTSLIYGPKEVGENYNCVDNKLISLEGMPENFKGLLNCSDNPIYSIYYLFNRNYKKYRDSLDYNYLRGTNIIKLRFGEALEEAGINEVPDSIEGYKYI